MALKVSGQPEQNLGIGVVCSLSPVTLSDVRRGEAAVEAQITIRDSQGTAVQTIHKPISGLGFG
jgi:hypothetical protein